jgi:hypothetical protein
MILSGVTISFATNESIDDQPSNNKVRCLPTPHITITLGLQKNRVFVVLGMVGGTSASQGKKPKQRTGTVPYRVPVAQHNMLSRPIGITFFNGRRGACDRIPVRRTRKKRKNTVYRRMMAVLRI